MSESRRELRKPKDKAEDVAAAPPVVVAPEPPKKYRRGDEVLLRARSGSWNYTYGPTYLYRGPRSIDEILSLGEPIVLVCDRIPMDELRKIELTRVRGFIFEEGSATDEELYNFLQNEKRAAVIGCKGASYFAEEGGWAIVDGVNGVVCFDPNQDTVAKFQIVREKGPPKRETMDAVAQTFRTMLDDAIKVREDMKAKGEYEKHPELTVKEAIKVQEEGPGLILQLLAGLPIPGAPGQKKPKFASHDHKELDHEELDDHRSDAEKRRDERRDKRDKAKEGAKNGGSDEKTDPEDLEDSLPEDAKRSAAADRKAAREAELKAQREKRKAGATAEPGPAAEAPTAPAADEPPPPAMADDEPPPAYEM